MDRGFILSCWAVVLPSFVIKSRNEVVIQVNKRLWWRADAPSPRIMPRLLSAPFLSCYLVSGRGRAEFSTGNSVDRSGDVITITSMPQTPARHDASTSMLMRTALLLSLPICLCRAVRWRQKSQLDGFRPHRRWAPRPAFRLSRELQAISAVTGAANFIRWEPRAILHAL